jgi:uncharacterized membrane protein YhaH (DUF805 family)
VLVDLLTRPWRLMFDFSGRSTRREYWLLKVQLLAASVALLLLASQLVLLFHSILVNGLMAMVLVLLVLFGTIATLAAGVRRLHDHNKSGWLLIITFVPMVGWVFYLIMMLTPGDEEANEYGPNPRYDEPIAEATAEVFA